jgi:hypothetical protein
MISTSFPLRHKYEDLYVKCFETENPNIINIFNKGIFSGHTILFSEEPNIIGKYFLKSQYKCNYILVNRMVNVSLDGERSEVEFFESKLSNGNIGHIEFDFLTYPKNKVYFILEEVVEPIVKTGDIGKMITSCGEDTSKIIYFKNLDVIIASLSDDKILNKMICWLEKYCLNNVFLMTFYNYNNNVAKHLVNHCNTIRIPRISNKGNINKSEIETWLKRHVDLEKNINNYRDPRSFLGFRYYMRLLVDEEYYEIFYEFIKDLMKTTKESDKYDVIRDFLIVWLQSGKNHKELMNELVYYVGKIKNQKLKMKLLEEIAKKAVGLENSKKIVYYLENILSLFI